ncbi:MAG: metalloregulator ArsR/SmtB family transcription factor [Planctomycetes bacterium]|nr:metalloregulator ArsR/SmtB family transcription factor [Planctomycetota bacterium]MCC7398966.1 winged helix-turn-helix transcriptional regulator [Planctomycetota bacterium]
MARKSSATTARPASPSRARGANLLDPVQVFRALGHASRLRLVEALGNRDACVDEMRELLGCSWSTVSQHLAVLRRAGIVACERQGNRVVHRLALPCVATFTSCLSAAANGQQVELRTCCT